MGEFNDNPDDKKECVFYDTNSQGHDYLEGRQPAWKSIELQTKIFRIISSKEYS